MATEVIPYKEIQDTRILSLLQLQQSFTESITPTLTHSETQAIQPTQLLTDTNSQKTTVSSAIQSQIPLLLSDSVLDSSAFPIDLIDVNRQQLDLRTQNSWVLKLGEIETPEIAQVFCVNALTPFTINNRLLSLMDQNRVDGDAKYIIHVSAMEGKFYRYKTPMHPHTNMAKAALNMMTRTCAEDLAKKRIYMNSVDTGYVFIFIYLSWESVEWLSCWRWINDENPLVKANAYAKESNFQTPIDEVDAAARILDPVYSNCNGEKPLYGKFLKDFHETEW